MNPYNGFSSEFLIHYVITPLTRYTCNIDQYNELICPSQQLKQVLA